MTEAMAKSATMSRFMGVVYHDLMWFVGLFGLAVGSFLNVLIDRLPQGKNVITGRSQCDYCGKTLRWFELVPLLSFFIQRGRCRRCHNKLSWQYPIVELVTAVAFAYGANPLVFSSLLVIFVADLKYQIIPDSMVVMGVIGVIGVIGEKNVASGFGAAAFFLLLWLVTRGKGMGLGDVKLAFLMGLLLGFPNIIIASYLAFLTGAASGVILILLGKKKLKEKIAFGPFLVAGTVIALIWGEQLLTVWRRLL